MFLKKNMKVISTFVFLILVIAVLSIIPFEKFNFDFYESAAQLVGWIILISNGLLLWGDYYV